MISRKVKLGEVCRIEKGAIGIQKAISGEYPMVVTGEERKSHNEFQFDDEAVLIPLVSGTGHGHASIKRIHFQTGKFALGSILCAVIPKDKTQLNAEYLYRFLDLNKDNELVARMKGMANVTLPIKEIAQIEIPLPSLKDQIRFIENYKNLEDINTQFSSELIHQLFLIKRLRQQILQDAVQGKLTEQNPKDESASELLKKIKSTLQQAQCKNGKELSPIKSVDIPFEIPDNWIWCRLGEICNNITKGSSPKWQGVQYVNEDEGILYITSKNVDSFKIDLTKATYVEEKFNKIEPRSILKKGDILTNIVGASIGRTALFDLDVIANINQAVCILRIEHKNIDKDYLLYLMNSDFALKMMSDSQFAPGRANLSMGNIASFTIPIPPISEQNRIVQKLDKLMQTCNMLENSIKQSAVQNEKLLQQVLREALQPKNKGVEVKTVR